MLSRNEAQCRTCNHPKRDEIEQALVAKVELRPLGKRYGLSIASLSRHHTKHMDPAGYTVIHGPASADFVSVIAELRGIADKAQGTLKLAALKELRAMLREQALAAPPSVVSLQTSEEWRRVREVIANALDPYPDAKRAVVQALMAVEDDPRPPSVRRHLPPKVAAAIRRANAGSKTHAT